VGAPAPVRTGIVALALLATLALTRVSTPVSASVAPNLANLPVALGPWSGMPAPPLDADVARVLAADQYVHRYYGGRSGTIEMDVAYYAQPRVGANMHSPLNCLPGTGWEFAALRDVDVTTSDGTWRLRDAIVDRRGARFALTYWFQSRDRILSGEVATRLYLLGDALRRRPTDASIVRLIMPVGTDASRDRATLASFATYLIPEISARLRS
jgi:EpsI family protein